MMTMNKNNPIVEIYIGASGSGKTKHIKDKYITKEVVNFKGKTGVKLAKCGKTLLFGHYNVGRRCEGCDTLPFDAIDKIIEELFTILKFGTCLEGDTKPIQDSIEVIVLDGDRINNDKFFTFLNPMKQMVRIHYFYAPLDILLSRIDNPNESFVKSTITKSKKRMKKLIYEGYTVITHKTKGKWW